MMMILTKEYHTRSVHMIEPSSFCSIIRKGTEYMSLNITKVCIILINFIYIVTHLVITLIEISKLGLLTGPALTQVIYLRLYA
jgi:hypothetical protein